MALQLVTLNCPACGAPVKLEENVLSILCAYCHSQVERAPDDFSAVSERAFQALLNAQYEQAELLFVETLKQNPGAKQSWLGRAVANCLKPYAAPTEALNYFHESGFSHNDAVDIMAKWSTSSSILFDDCLKRRPELAAQAPILHEILIEGALQSTNPAHQHKIAQTCTALAEQKWAEGQVDQAVAYMKRALKIDPDQRPENLWMLDLARKS
jgi:tetratricopeptide (TPR) repeat protein